MSPTFRTEPHSGLCQCGMCRPNVDPPKDVPGRLYFPRPGRTYTPRTAPRTTAQQDFTPVTPEDNA